MKKTMIATVLGLALMPLTFAAQTPATDKSAAPSTSTDTTKPVKKHKNHKKSTSSKAPAAKTAPAATPAPAQK